MPRVILHAGQALDDHRHAGQGPEIGTEAGRPRPLPQCRFHPGQLALIQPRLAARAASGSQARPAPGPPGPIPPHDALATDAEDARDGSLRVLASGKQARRLLSTTFQSTEIASGGNMSGHASMICWQDTIVTILCETQ